MMEGRARTPMLLYTSVLGKVCMSVHGWQTRTVRTLSHPAVSRFPIENLPMARLPV
jgi:hypothetical protein